jgi:hypothetical protein
VFPVFVLTDLTELDVASTHEEMDIPCILSGLTPTEVWRAHEVGVDFAKIVAPTTYTPCRVLRHGASSISAYWCEGILLAFAVKALFIVTDRRLACFLIHLLPGHKLFSWLLRS